MKASNTSKNSSKVFSAVLSVKQCVEYLGKSRNAIYMLVARKGLPYRKLGKQVIFLRDELDAFLERLPGKSISEFKVG